MSADDPDAGTDAATGGDAGAEPAAPGDAGDAQDGGGGEGPDAERPWRRRRRQG
jgi:hypothetical protein